MEPQKDSAGGFNPTVLLPRVTDRTHAGTFVSSLTVVQPAGVTGEVVQIRGVTLLFVLISAGCTSPGSPPAGKNSFGSGSGTVALDTRDYHPNPAPYRGNLQRTGVCEGTGTPNLTKLLWPTATEYFTDGVVVADGLAYYIVSNYGLHALDTTTGKLK